MPRTRAPRRGITALLSTLAVMALSLGLAPMAANAGSQPSPTPSAGTPTPSGTPAASATPPASPASSGTTSSSSPTANPTFGNQPAPSATQGPGAKAAAPAAMPQSQLAIQKSNDLGGAPLTPGTDFRYQLTLSCSSLRVDCVNATFTDTLPVGLDVTSLPLSTSTRTVTYDAATRLLTIVFQEPLDNPAGQVGLQAGAPVNFEVGMRLPPDTTLLDGSVVSNTGTVVADNADRVSDTNNITVSVPRVVTPVATKTWPPGSAVAGSDATSTIHLGVRNASSSSAAVTQLSVVDETPATFEYFNLTGVTLTALPPGADQAQVFVKTTGGYLAGGTAGAPGTLSLPPGVNPADVTGVRVGFTNTAGTVLPTDPTGGGLDLGMQLRDTLRSDGSPIDPQNRVTVNNCVTPGATDSVQGAVTGANACKPFDILPSTIAVQASKNFFPDTNGDFTQQAGEYAVLGQNSAASTTVDVKNVSPFNVLALTITEPDPTAPNGNEFYKFDTSKVRLRFPAGATTARMSVTYDDGTTTTNTYTANQTVPVAKAGARVQKVTVTYTGTDANGDPAIRQSAVAGLDLSGNLNDQVTSDDLPNGSSPGVRNCAGWEGDPGFANGTGSASGTACKDLQIVLPKTNGTGVKSVGQTSVPPGQPIPFTLKLTNNGTLPLINPVMSDPRTQPDGTPDPNFPNPFDQLQIVSANTNGSSAGIPGVDLQLFDPLSNTWVPYNQGDATLLARARGIRAVVNGSLTPAKQVTLNLVTMRRDGVGDNVPILNCFDTSSGGAMLPGAGGCSPQVETGPADDSASLNKSISPGSLPAFVPGLPPQYANVSLTVRNNGNLSMQRIRVTDQDVSFFDGVDFAGFQAVNLPAGANRVQVDAYVNGVWVNGTPQTTAVLPPGVVAANVTGIRATFVSTDVTTNNGYVITPCAATSCEGNLTFRVSPRQALRSTGQPVPNNLTDTATGEFVTVLEPPDQPKQIPPDDATLVLTKGTPKLAVDKYPDTALSPGETAPFYLKVTNSGTANVPDLVVKDALPPGIQFDDTFKGDNGQPFKVINTQVPSGTPPVPAPTFRVTNDGEHVSALEWNFGFQADGTPWVLAPGATLTIQIQVTLEPGIQAGDVVQNAMGASSTDPDLACSGRSEVNGQFGDGRYCIDTATLTAKAGAAFRARKWVAGNDALGWYNTQTGSHVATGSRSCPSTLDAAGRHYTAYPCIALVNPGDQYNYLLRVVNAGTEPGTDMRIIDRFPVTGDKGVIINQNRGTEWNHRPTLASPPSLSGPGTLTTLYSDNEPICTKDLAMGGAGSTSPQCAPGDWNAAFSPAVVAAQMQLKFPNPLAPGKGVDITFAMNTPLDVAQVSDPTIAWNSYAHAETTLRNNKPHVLPATEPIQVGVGLAYGGLRLQKLIGANPSNLPLADLAFPFQVHCVIHPIGVDPRVVLDQSYDVSANQPVTIANLPAGAECQVWETDAHGGLTSNDAANPVTVTIPPSYGDTAVATAQITNDFPDAVIRLRKIVIGPAAKYAPDLFPVDVHCSFRGQPLSGFDPKRVDVRPNNPSLVVDVPAGAHCYAVEADSGGATQVTYLPDDPNNPGQSGVVSAQSGNPQDIAITNDYRAGGLQIVKDLSGPGVPELSNGPFTFDVSCGFNGADPVFTQTVTLTGNGTGKTLMSDPVTGLPVGAVCTVTETANGGADVTPAPVTVTIPDEVNGTPQIVPADLTNLFSGGTLSLSKVLAGAGAGQPYAVNTRFTVQVTCQREDSAGQRTTVFSQPVTIVGGETIPMLDANGNPVKLPLGSHCFGAETDTGGATTATVDYSSYDNAAIVTAAPDIQPLTITATNTFDLGGLSLSKVVTGGAASYVGDRTFILGFSCVLPQGATMTPLFTDRPYTMSRGQTVGVDGLPIGARCWAQESDAGGATTTTIDHGNETNAAVVTADTRVGITATNVFDAGVLTVMKRVVNGPPGPYSFTLSCKTGRGPVALRAADASFKLKAGQKRRITVPLGAACAVTEVRPPSGTRVTYTDSDRVNNGRLVVNGQASVTVTNTFKHEQSGTSNAGTPPSGSLSYPVAGTAIPDTGGPSIWLLVIGLLAVMGGLVLVRRRRR